MVSFFNFLFMVKIFKEHILFFVIFFICAILRFIPFFEYQFTLDELSGLSRTTFTSFDDLIEKGVKTTDTHPALIQIFIFCIAKLFGYANWVVKLPFLLMSLGVLIYGYIFSLRNFSKQTGIIASLIFGFSFIFVFYAPIARMYISGVFLSMAMLYYFFEIFFQHNNKTSNYFFLGLFALLSALNQHINCLFAFTVCASGLLFLNKSNAKPFLITCLIVILCYLPHLPVTIYQLNVGGIGFDQDGWLPPPERSALYDFLRVLTGTGKTIFVFVIIVVLAIILNKSLKLTKKQIYLGLIFLINFSVIYFYSISRAPVFQYSVMLFSSVAAVTFLASFINFKNTIIFNACVVLIATVLIYKSYFKKDFYHQSVKTVFEYQFERSAHYKKLFGDKNVYPLFFDADNFMKDIYFKKYGTFDCKISSDSEIVSTRAFNEFVSQLDCDYLILASAFPKHQAMAAEYFPYLIENTQTQGINFKLYSKNPNDKSKIVDEDKVLNYSNVSASDVFIYSKSKDPTSSSQPFSLPVDSVDDFPFEVKAHYNDLVTAEGQVLLVKSSFKLSNIKSGGVTTCISVNDTETKTSYMYNSNEISNFIIRPDSTVDVYVDNFFGTNHKKARYNSNVVTYIWNRGKDNFSITGFETKLIDYWPRKWHLWD